MKKKSQNQNESLHAKVWNKCRKIKHAGKFREKFVVQLTVWNNSGYEKCNLLVLLEGRRIDETSL